MNKQQEFLDEIEREIEYIVDGYYGSVIPEIMDKIKVYLDDNATTWHPAKNLSTPRIPLKIRLEDGSIVDGMRPSYIAKYSMNDLGYRTLAGDVLMNVKEWTIA